MPRTSQIIRLAGFCSFFLLANVAALTSAYAELKLCNVTTSRVGVAIGYQDGRGWASEGWWNIGAQTCEILLKGPSPSRYIYVFARDYERGGSWTGEQTMCIADRTFVIRDVSNCVERGFDTEQFYKVDTGSATNWTIRLSDSEKVKAGVN